MLTATKRPGGLDVTYAALRGQTYKDFYWIIMDELADERFDIFMDNTGDLEFSYGKPRPKPEGYYSDLPAIYNSMIEEAILNECELAVSLQDYIWIEPNGIELFVQAAEAKPGAIVAGLCSMAANPQDTWVKYQEGLWTIFQEPYEGPQFYPGGYEIEWQDVRGAKFEGRGLQRATPVDWEMNWAMFPLDIEARFDETYGEHIGHENQQFARDCGREVYVQMSNHALSLPHRHYFPEEWEEQQPHRYANQARHLAREDGGYW